MDHRTKVYKLSKDGTSRLKFASAKSRSKHASADVYRTSDKRVSSSSTAVREKRVHDAAEVITSIKRTRRNRVGGGEGEDVRYLERENDSEGLGIGRTAVIVSSKSKLAAKAKQRQEEDSQNTQEETIGIGVNELDEDSEEEHSSLLTDGTLFFTELEVASQRNGSQVFRKLVRELRPLCKSLAELLHYSERIADTLYAYLLSPRGSDGQATPLRRKDEEWKSYLKHLKENVRDGYVVHVATNDVLHLLGVLARELRHEIYPYLNTRLLPRIVGDLLNPPTNIVDSVSSEKRSNVAPLDVSHIETAFRSMSYLFKYSSNRLIENYKPDQIEPPTKQAGDADILRQYYGMTICHKRDIVRRLACESYAPILRKCTDKGLKRHLNRTVKALASSLAAAMDGDSTQTAKRARDDAIDGVASLLFEVARGAPGSIHSKKGLIVLKALSECLLAGLRNSKSANDVIELRKAEAIYEVASAVLYKLRGHIVRGSRDGPVAAFDDVFACIHRALEEAIVAVKESSACGFVLGHIIELETETIEFQDGRLVSDVDGIVGSLQEFLSEALYPNASKALQDKGLRYLCAAWKSNPTHPSFALRIGKYFPSVLSLSDDNSLGPALFLSKNLLPHLPKKIASRYLIPALMNAVASQDRSDESLVLLHTVATTVWIGEGVVDTASIDLDDQAADKFFTSEGAEFCPDFPSELLKRLFDMCLEFETPSDRSTGQEREYVLGKIGYVARCMPFLVSLGCSRGDDDSGGVSSSNELIGRVFHWFASISKELESTVDEKTHITQALVFEAFSKSSIECHRRLSSSVVASIGNALSTMRSCANNLLFSHPKSAWVVRGVAAVTRALSILDPVTTLNDRANETFEILVSNLADSNHFVRLQTLAILESFPARPFVTDHADLDLTDDLDEEPSQRPNAQSVSDDISGPDQSTFSGSCNIISMLSDLERTPIVLTNERRITSLLSRVEVFSRTGKLPIVYAEAVVCHMLGLLHVKFAPIWASAVKVIVAISTAQEGPVWPYIKEALEQSMSKLSLPNNKVDDMTTDGWKTHYTASISRHYALCNSWESSEGRLVDIFSSELVERNSQISRYSLTDELTIFENTWSICENAPNLTATKSKVIVHLFLVFLRAQYFVFHHDEPDLRELNIASNAVDERFCDWSKAELGRKSVQKKLECFLKVFAAVKGPQQLYKHKLLLQISTAMLGNADHRLSNLSFACVLRYKLPHLAPYVQYIQPMLKKEGLREALTKFDLSVDSEMVDTDHRLQLIPIVTRILFGRFSSRGNGSKKSTDSPAARRAAILSFFSWIGNDGGELSFFVYLMVRAFVPRRVSLQSLQADHSVQFRTDFLVDLISASGTITASELAAIPCKRQEGFLNLLSDVITQIGFGIEKFVPTLTSLLLAICEQAEEVLVNNIKLMSMKDDDEDGYSDAAPLSRIGKIRSLCFLRIADVLNKFGSSIDFCARGCRLWKAMRTSVDALPNTVINADSAPSLLQLIEKISSNRSLIPLLEQSDESVVAVFKCIAGTTRSNVMSCVLKIIDGLLTDGGTLDKDEPSCTKTTGQNLVLKNIHLLISQFTIRLKDEAQIANLDDEILSGSNSSKRTKVQHHGLQLNILCRVSELLVSAEETADHHVKTMEDLCKLLTPLLKFGSHPSQLELLRTIKSLVPKLSANDAVLHYQGLSKLLGPNKNEIGIQSKEHRQLLSDTVGAICCLQGTAKTGSIIDALQGLNSVSTSYVDEHDFDKLLPVINALGTSSDSQGSWLQLACSKGEPMKASQCGDPRLLLPLVYTCFHLLYDEDGVVSRAANKALKALITTCAEQSPSEPNAMRNPWFKMAEATLVHSLKMGISTKDSTVRRSFVMLVSYVASSFNGCASERLFGDLRCLVREDDQELDFFLNVTHVQLHRRTRGLGRLRKMLSSDDQCNFFDQSLSNVLLPLALHPIYECKSKSEEPFVIEAIATVGIIAKHLKWSKYNSTLQSVLANLPRYPDQERFLIALVCAILDAFHFSVETGDSGTQSQGNGVWRTLNNRIIPKVDSYLIKEKVDHRGKRVTSLRPSVVLALMKLFQKLPVRTFEVKLPKLIATICNALKSKDSNKRDVARETMSKMAVSLELKYLPMILSELAVSLSEGYKLHVRSATLHSIVVALSKRHRSTGSTCALQDLPYDRCIPAMLDLIHQDLFDDAAGIKDAKHVEKSLVKEAKGSKSLDSLEIISRSCLFKPSMARAENATQTSVVHALVTPFIDRLRDPDVKPSTIRKVKECLNRVAVGFSSNPTTEFAEILPFVFATTAPFVDDQRGHLRTNDELEEDSGDEANTPIQVSGGSLVSTGKQENDVVAVATWVPTSLGRIESQKEAIKMRRMQKKALHKVIDGSAAPKLTGSGRSILASAAKANTSLNNPTNACALSFGLTLLNSSLKRSKIDVTDESLVEMADPYLRLLTHCVRFSSDSNAVVLSLRSLGILLRLNLPSVSKFARSLGPSILDHITSSHAASNTQSDLVQSCFRSLTLLISHKKFSGRGQNGHEQICGTLPLSSEQMQALLSLLHSAVRESDHHNATFGLIKAILNKKYMSSEFYDLMDIVQNLSVQSLKDTIRLQSSQIFLQYLIDYPMGSQRIERHLQQAILNCEYEYEGGRLSAIELVASIINKFPPQILEERSQLFFLPLVLRLVNDDSQKCKDAVSGAIASLLKRSSTDTVQSLYEYIKRWSEASGPDSLPMQKASAQLFGLFVDSRPDYIRGGSTGALLVVSIADTLQDKSLDWELAYFNLTCVEKISNQLQSLLPDSHHIWPMLVTLLKHPHPPVKQVSSRIIYCKLSTLDPSKLFDSGSFFASNPGSLHDMASNLCRQLDVEDSVFVEPTSLLAIKNLSWLFRAIRHSPALCYREQDSPKDDGEIQKKDPCRWLMTRLSNIARPKDRLRRESVFKCFAAFAASCNGDDLVPYLELIIDPLDRAIREASNMSRHGDNHENDPRIALPKDVLQMFEEKCGTSNFLQAYVEVNKKVRHKRDKRKGDIAAEKVSNPGVAAKRKIAKQLREKERKKRRVNDHRRGVKNGSNR